MYLLPVSLLCPNSRSAASPPSFWIVFSRPSSSASLLKPACLDLAISPPSENRSSKSEKLLLSSLVSRLRTLMLQEVFELSEIVNGLHQRATEHLTSEVCFGLLRFWCFFAQRTKMICERRIGYISTFDETVAPDFIAFVARLKSLGWIFPFWGCETMSGGRLEWLLARQIRPSRRLIKSDGIQVN